MASWRISAAITGPCLERGVREPPAARSNSPENRTVQRITIALSVIIAVFASRAPGQRAPSAAYDDQRKVKLAGPVTKVDWTNPSAFLLVNVKDAGGTVTPWEVEIGNPLDLEKSGWKRDSLHVGDVVNVE